LILRAKKSRVSIGFCARLYPSGTILTLLFSTQINDFFYFSMFRLFAPHALNGQKPIKQHALKGQKLLAQGSALGYFVRNLVAL
jgi:hypothetical protein